MVTKLLRRLDRLKDLKSSGSDWRSNGSDRSLPLESSSDDRWGPGPHLGRSHGRFEAPGSNHTLSGRGSARLSHPMLPRRSGEEERGERLDADYCRCRDPLRTPIQPKRPRHAREPAPPTYCRY